MNKSIEEGRERSLGSTGLKARDLHFRWTTNMSARVRCRTVCDDVTLAASSPYGNNPPRRRRGRTTLRDKGFAWSRTTAQPGTTFGVAVRLPQFQSVAGTE
jgi:hypothetical protein